VIPGQGPTAVFLTNGGVVLVDTKLPGIGEPIRKQVRTVTDQPVSVIISTHAYRA
jgi:hypothetical protein